MSVNIKTESGLEKIAGNYAGSVTKETIGLGNVDNTSDANKPISTATQTALDNKEDSANKVSGWQSTPDNNHYPSEKLVKDGLDAKVAKVKIGETEYAPASGIVTIPSYPTKLPASDVTDTYSATGKVPVSGTAVASAISGKENSANRVSSWSATTSNAKYPSEKLVKDSLDNKVQKTSVSSSKPDGETTSVINVTDAKAQMAMVASIKGKTVKVCQKYSSCTYDNFGCKITTDSSTLKTTITANNTTSVIYAGLSDPMDVSSQMVSVTGHKYYIRVTGANSTSKFSIYNDNGGVTLRPYEATSIVATATADKRFYIRVEAGVTFNATVNIIIFDLTVMGMTDKTAAQLDAMFTSYVPHGSYLWNTPVESVVSVGKNRLNASDIVNGYWSSVDGTWGASSNYCANKELIKMNPGETFVVSAPNSIGTSVYSVIFYDANKQFKSESTNSTTESTRVFNMPNDCYYIGIKFRNSAAFSPSSFQYVFVQLGTDKTMPYVPYNKTTVLVPSEARNCVGYGLGISDSVCNIVDFENGVYTQMCDELDFDKLADSMYFNQSYENHVVGIKVTGKASSVAVCSKYPYVALPSLGVVNIPDKTFTMGANGQMYIKDSAIAETTNPTQIKAVLAGAKAVYQLANPATKALTDFIRPLPVENGGTLTLVNEHNLDMPSVIKYKKEV